MNRSTVLKLAVVLALAIGLSALREFCFYNLNYQISFAAGQTSGSYAHSMVRHLLEGWTLGGLVQLKWILAVFFIGAMGTLTFLTGRILFAKRLDRPIVGGIALIAVLALVLHGLARWLPFTAAAGVKLLHLLQYPMPIVFLIIASFLPGAARDEQR